MLSILLLYQTIFRYLYDVLHMFCFKGVVQYGMSNITVLLNQSHFRTGLIYAWLLLRTHRCISLNLEVKYPLFVLPLSCIVRKMMKLSFKFASHQLYYSSWLHLHPNPTQHQAILHCNTSPSVNRSSDQCQYPWLTIFYVLAELFPLYFFSASLPIATEMQIFILLIYKVFQELLDWAGNIFCIQR